MFNTVSNIRTDKILKARQFRSRNWEEDIDDVALEACSVDPTGFKVRYHRLGMKDKFNENFDTFHIGASLLDKRLQRIIEAGYEAPMTEKALAMLEGHVPSATHAVS